MRVRFDRVWTGSEANPSRPVSRVLSGRGSSPRRDGHSSGTPVTGRLEQPTRAAGPTDKALRRLTRRASLLFGFAPGGACHAADVAARAVRSYRTLSPLPSRLLALRPAIKAVCFLWRFPWGRPRRTLSGAVSVWSPDFPPFFRRRPSGRLAEEGIGGESEGGQAESDLGQGRGREPMTCVVH